MPTNINKEGLLEEDIETGFGVSSQTRGGQKVNADSLPYSETQSIKQALDAREPTTNNDLKYAMKNGDATEEFLVSQGSSPSRAVQKTELDNAPFAKTGGDTAQPFLVADATLGQEATNRDITQDMINDSLVPFAQIQNVLVKTNTVPYTPTQSYHPATKVYVDEKVLGVFTFQGEDTLDNILLASPTPGHIWQSTTADPASAIGPVAIDDMIAASEASVWVNMGAIQGPKGDTGDTGPTGTAGADGADSTVPGPTGPQGQQGITGADSTVPGPQGPEGPEGPEGPDGPTGADSTVPGPEGPDGPQGPAGTGLIFHGYGDPAVVITLTATTIGDAYTANAAGVDSDGTTINIDDVMVADDLATPSHWVSIGAVKGEKGDQGDAGTNGTDGGQGIQGDAGADGTNGTNGTDGTGWTAGAYDGATGIVTFDSVDGLGFSTTDLRGADGADGVQGIQGNDGDDGADGATGAQGLEGPTAVSADANNLASIGSDSLLMVSVDSIHPIGSVVLRMDAVDPATLFGGTWSLITGDASLSFGDGTTRDGVASGDNTPVNTLAEHSHANTAVFAGDALAPHTHTIETDIIAFSADNISGAFVKAGAPDPYITSGASAGTPSGSVNMTNVNVGTSGATLDVRGAQISINVWKRTA